MNNTDIIRAHQKTLAEAGKIRAPVETVKLSDGQILTVCDYEEIHTFAAWKSRGYSVKKGAHAVAAFPVWKFKSRTRTDDETGEEIDESRMFLQKAYFFSASQVQEITR